MNTSTYLLYLIQYTLSIGHSPQHAIWFDHWPGLWPWHLCLEWLDVRGSTIYLTNIYSLYRPIFNTVFFYLSKMILFFKGFYKLEYLTKNWFSLKCENCISTLLPVICVGTISETLSHKQLAKQQLNHRAVITDSVSG